MPSKSSSMNQMPIQTKIGDASLKFGPDWLRALSSDNSTTGTTGTSGTGSGHSGGGWASGSGGGGGSGERASVERSPIGSYHHGSSVREREKEPDRDRVRYSNHSNINASSSGSSSAPPLLPPNRFKPSEFRYTREEILTLYDKNLQAPDYLTKFGNLFVEKMQPPMSFSQPSEEELRTWHVPQPESSRLSGGGGSVGVGGLSSPLSRGGGFAARGRGIDRGGRGGGRGGRGGYYGRPHEDEDPRFRQQHSFSRSLSAHERNWVPDRERNGLAGSPPEPENSRGGGGGNWRNRNSDSYSKGGNRFDDAEDGWRNKPRWRRDDDEEYTPPRNSTRRVHKSWSDDGTQDLPEWAKDNPIEESGTFDSSGAFHDEDRYSAKTNAFELSRRSEAGDQGKETGKEESSQSTTGSQHNRVQKKSERNNVRTTIKETEEEPLDPPHRSKPSKSKSPSPPPQAPTDEVKEPLKQKDKPHDVKTQEPLPFQASQKPVNEEHYRSLSEDADSLVAKLIEDDAAMVHQVHEPSLPPAVSSIPVSLTSVTGNSSVSAVQQLSTPPPLPPSLGSPDVWFYRDPQGNVQGPFASSEMSLWLSQGYFTGGLYLRRECDKIFITLSEMGKLYGRNPFVNQPDAITPPPLQDGNNGASALDPLLVEPLHPGHPQFHQKQIFHQQQQYLLNALQGQSRKENDVWSQVASGNSAGNSNTAAQLQQAQILLSNMVKVQGSGGLGMGGPDSSFDLQTLFQRHAQLKNQDKGGDYRNSNASSQIPNQQNDGIVVDPIQSLLHQLTNMTNTHGQGQGVGLKGSSGGGGNGWGPAVAPNAWNSQIPSIPTTSAGNPLWDYREQYMKLQQMKAEEELLARKKKEEEMERKRIQEEEEARKRMEAEQKRLEIEQEQKRAYEELLQQQQLAAAELARQREELALQQRLQQQELARQRMEQERALEKQREALQKLEQQRLEQQRIEQARLEKEREEERERERERERQEQERRAQAELEEQKRREERRIQQELQIKKMQEIQQQQQQLLQQQQQKAPWNATSGAQAPRTLLEIQEEEAIQLEQRRAQQLALKKKQDEEARERQREQQSRMSLTWAQPLMTQSAVPIKSLAEIQAEEAAKLEEKRREKELQNRQHNLQQGWNPAMTWANRASLNAPPVQAQKGNGGSVWEEGRKKWEAEPLPAVTPSLAKAAGHSSLSSKVTGKDSEDSFLKLIQDHGLSVGDGSGRGKEGGAEGKTTEDPFTQWCYETVRNFAGNVDVPTFINFLKEVESPFEVNDYVRSYLGDGKEVREFARQFIEKRSRWKSVRSSGAGKEGKGFEETLFRPASTANPPTTEFQEVKGKKGKKGKMQKVDARILGFNTTSAPDRLNVGKRDYGDGSDN